MTAKTDLVQGNAVYIHEDTDNDTIYADKADASDTSKMPSFGLALKNIDTCLLYTSPSPRDRQKSRMPSSA